MRCNNMYLVLPFLQTRKMNLRGRLMTLNTLAGEHCLMQLSQIAVHWLRIDFGEMNTGTPPALWALLDSTTTC